jgi:hypothetical protein
VGNSLFCSLPGGRFGIYISDNRYADQPKTIDFVGFVDALAERMIARVPRVSYTVKANSN